MDKQMVGILFSSGDEREFHTSIDEVEKVLNNPDYCIGKLDGCLIRLANIIMVRPL